MHFNALCHISETNYKLNTYNDVYKKYKLRRAKNQKKIDDRMSFDQLMDPETLNMRKTRKRYEFKRFKWIFVNLNIK